MRHTWGTQTAEGSVALSADEDDKCMVAVFDAQRQPRWLRRAQVTVTLSPSGASATLAPVPGGPAGDSETANTFLGQLPGVIGSASAEVVLAHSAGTWRAVVKVG